MVIIISSSIPYGVPAGLPTGLSGELDVMVAIVGATPSILKVLSSSKFEPGGIVGVALNPFP